MSYKALSVIDGERPELLVDITQGVCGAVAEQVEIAIKYEGYVKRQLMQVEHFKKLEKRRIPTDINYGDISGLRTEAVQKLGKIKPGSVGQASRISGVSPADISVLLIYIEHMNRMGEAGKSNTCRTHSTNDLFPSEKDR